MIESINADKRPNLLRVRGISYVIEGTEAGCTVSIMATYKHVIASLIASCKLSIRSPPSDAIFLSMSPILR